MSLLLYALLAVFLLGPCLEAAAVVVAAVRVDFPGQKCPDCNAELSWWCVLKAARNALAGSIGTFEPYRPGQYALATCPNCGLPLLMCDPAVVAMYDLALAPIDHSRFGMLEYENGWWKTEKPIELLADFGVRLELYGGIKPPTHETYKLLDELCRRFTGLWLQARSQPGGERLPVDPVAKSVSIVAEAEYPITLHDPGVAGWITVSREWTCQFETVHEFLMKIFIEGGSSDSEARAEVAEFVGEDEASLLISPRSASSGSAFMARKSS